MTTEKATPEKEPPRAKGLLGKLHSIAAEVGYIQKDATNAFHKYNYASEKAIKTALHAAFVQHGILMQLNTSNIRIVPDNKGTTLIDVGYAFIDCATGERLEGTFVSSGSNGQDKGVWIAVTGAIKYILTSMFLIPTGDDPEDPKNNTDDDNNGKVKTDKPAKPKAPSDNHQAKRAAFKALMKASGYKPESEKEFDSIVHAVCSREGARELCLEHEIDTLFLPAPDGVLDQCPAFWAAAVQLLAVTPKREIDDAILRTITPKRERINQ